MDRRRGRAAGGRGRFAPFLFVAGLLCVLTAGALWVPKPEGFKRALSALVASREAPRAPATEATSPGAQFRQPPPRRPVTPGDGTVSREVSFNTRVGGGGQDAGVVSREVSFNTRVGSGGQDAGVVSREVSFNTRVGSGGQDAGVVSREVSFNTRVGSGGQDAGVVSREVSFRHSPVPPTVYLDALARAFTVENAPAAPPAQLDALARAFTVENAPAAPPAQLDALARAFTVENAPAAPPAQLDALARAFTVENAPAAPPTQLDSLARAFTVENAPTPPPAQLDALARAFTVENAPAAPPAQLDALARAFTVENTAPDLTIASVLIPPIVEEGQEFAVSWTTLNEGRGTAIGPWRERVAFSLTPEPTNPVTLRTVESNGILPPQGKIDFGTDVTIPKGLVQTEGTYYLVFTTDADRQILEGDREGNNVAIVPIRVSVVPLPNLVVTDIEAPASVFFGEAMEVRFRIQNVGPGATNSSEWRDEVALVRAGEPARAEVTLLNPAFLAPGEAYWSTARITVPRGTFGDWQVRVMANVNRGLGESRLEDNTRLRPIRIEVPPLPDLAASAVRGPEFGGSGGQLLVSWQVNNLGDSPTPPTESSWIDTVYLNATPDLLGKPIRIATRTHTGQLKRRGEAGDSYRVQDFAATVPRGVEGSLFVVVQTNSNNGVFEFGRTENNVAASSRPVEIAGRPAFLTCRIDSSPSQVTGGEPYTVAYTVRNEGAFPALPSWVDAVYFSEDDKLDAEDEELARIGRAEALEPGASYSGEFQLRAPLCTDRAGYFLVKADAFDEVPTEGDPAAKVSAPRAVTFSFQPADLAVESVTSATQVRAGDPLEVSWSVRNAGAGSTNVSSWTDTVYLSRTPTTAETLLGSFRRVGALAPGGSYRRQEVVRIPALADGTYYIVVRTNVGSQVEECGATGNNTRGGASLQVEPLGSGLGVSDLRAIGVSVPASGRSGEKIEATWQIQNDGPDPVQTFSWFDTLYLSTDPTYSPEDRPLASQGQYAPLDVGAGYEGRASFLVPQVPAGRYWIVARANASGVVPEGGRTGNNVQSAPFDVRDQEVDLAVVATEIPAEALSGEDVAMAWTVKNSGAEATVQTSWVDAVVLSRDRNLDGSDRVFGTFARTEALGAGETYRLASRFRVPAGLTGPYFVFVVTDWANQVPETDPFNNSSEAAPITLSLPPPVDLTPVGATFPATGAPGEPTRITWRVRNVGQNAATGRWVDAVYLSKTPTWTPDAELVGRYETAGPLAAGAEYEGVVEVDLPGVDTGDYFVVVKTNVRNTQRESELGNNTFVATETMRLDLLDLPLGTEYRGVLRVGRDKFFRTTVPGDETVRYVVDVEDPDTTSATRLLVNEDRMVRRSDFRYSSRGVWEADQTLTVPQTRAGTLFSLLFMPFAADDEPFSIRPAIIPFSVSSVARKDLGDEGNVTVRFEGAKFTPEMRVELVGSQATYRAARVAVKDPSQARATFDLTRAVRGAYSLRISADGRSFDFPEPLTIGQAVRSNQFLRLLPTPNYRFGANITQIVQLENEGNVDVPALRVFFQVEQRGVAIANDRPEDTVPLKSALPDADWINDSPTNSRGEASSSDFFVVYDLAPGETVAASFTALGRTIGASPVRTTVWAMPTNAANTRALLLEAIEDLRLVLLSGVVDDVPADVLRLALDERAWASTILSSLDSVGLIPPDDLKGQGGGSGGGPGIQGEGACQVKAFTDFAIASGFAFRDLAECGLVTGGTAAGVCVGKFFLGRAVSIASFLCALAECADEAKPCESQRGESRFCKGVRYVDTGLSIFSVGKVLLLLKQGKTLSNVDLAEFLNDVRSLGETGYDALKADKCHPYRAPVDPNQKTGPSGFGPTQIVGRQGLPYLVEFENLPTAQATAVRVLVTDDLPRELDWRTMRLNEIGFGKYRVQVPPNRAFFEGQVQLGPELGNLVAEVSANLNVRTGRLTLVLQAIDPLTGEPPVSQELGLLPPEDGSGRGKGFVSFTVRPRVDVGRTGTIIENSAVIKFDEEASIATGPTRHELDPFLPTSRVDEVTGATGAQFQVRWSGVDNAGGSGLATYDVYVQKNDGPFELWLGGTQETSGVYNGVAGFKYGFYTRATDNVGNVEPAKGAAEVTVETTRFGPGAAPLPRITSLTPGEVRAGGPTFTLVIRGRDFNGDAKVFWGDEERPVRWLSGTELEVSVSATLIETPGDFAIVVANPGERGLRKSSPRTFRVVP